MVDAINMKPSDADVMLRRLAVAATGMTGADVERAMKDARHIARRANRALAYADIEHALTPGRPAMSTELRWHVAVHKAGHAVAWSVTGRGRIQRMTVGPVAGGRTEVTLHTDRIEDELLFNDLLICLLAGRAAEWTIFGRAFAGSGGSPDSDLAQATMLAMRMETELGMSEGAPLLYVPTTNPGQDLRLDPTLARKVNRRLEAAYEAAKAMMTTQRGLLLALAQVLATRTVLDASEVEAVPASHFGERSES